MQKENLESHFKLQGDNTTNKPKWLYVSLHSINWASMTPGWDCMTEGEPPQKHEG
jgi:hypothetical protein